VTNAHKGVEVVQHRVKVGLDVVTCAPHVGELGAPPLQSQSNHSDSELGAHNLRKAKVITMTSWQETTSAASAHARSNMPIERFRCTQEVGVLKVKSPLHFCLFLFCFFLSWQAQSYVYKHTSQQQQTYKQTTRSRKHTR
jgi:hypothetical protein